MTTRHTRNILNAFFRDTWQANARTIVAEHAANPEAHKKSMYFPDGLRWRWYETKRKGRSTVRWCYTSTRNAAGYYLCFRQTIRKKRSGKNDQISAFKRKCDAIETARLNHAKLQPQE